MKRFYSLLALAVMLAAAVVAYAVDKPLAKADVMMAVKPPPPGAEIAPLPERVLGKADAPITVDEFVSLTCSHCAAFYNDIMPELKKQYVDTGKVKFILHDFPLDGAALKAATLARCMPEDEYFPFIAILYKNQMAWVMNEETDKTLVQYAKLGGLAEDKANACIKDEKIQQAVVTERTTAEQKYHITGTPVFIINNGAQILQGSQPVTAFTQVFDKLLAAKQ